MRGDELAELGERPVDVLLAPALAAVGEDAAHDLGLAGWREERGQRGFRGTHDELRGARRDEGERKERGRREEGERKERARRDEGEMKGRGWREEGERKERARREEGERKEVGRRGRKEREVGIEK